MFADSREAWDIIMNTWRTVVDYHNCDAYDEKGFESICSSWPLFVDYVKKTGSFPTRRNLLGLGQIKSCIWATLPQIGIFLNIFIIRYGCQDKYIRY